MCMADWFELVTAVIIAACSFGAGYFYRVLIEKKVSDPKFK